LLELTIYCVLIVAASLLGGWLPSLIALTHARMQVMMSAVGGLMLGIALFHMFPHSLEILGLARMDVASVWMMAGLVTMFFLLRTFHFHHHEPSELGPAHAAGPHDCHAESHAHVHHHADAGGPVGSAARGGVPRGIGPHELSWLGVFFGLGLHTLIDGLALAASVQSDLARGAAGGWKVAGAATFLAILVHKPLDAVSITSLMTARRWTLGSKLLVSAGFALMCPLGAILFVSGLGRFSGSEELILGGALAFSAGVFLCISLSDLLPEMEFHSHHRLLLSGALLAGIAVAWLLHVLEPGHDHGPSPASPQTSRDREF
jgi:zinc and cadmium transporter